MQLVLPHLVMQPQNMPTCAECAVVCCGKGQDLVSVRCNLSSCPEATQLPLHTPSLPSCCVPCSVAYGKIEVYEEGVCEVDLFVQDQEGARITDGWVAGSEAGWLGGTTRPRGCH